VRTVAEGGVKHFIIHARKCLLKGLSPAENRSIPPLQYDRVVRLCHEFPELNFTLNGGVTSLDVVGSILDSAPANLVGVMIGRAALGNPCMLLNVDSRFYGEPQSTVTRYSILQTYCEYLEREYPDVSTVQGTGLVQGALKPVLAVFNGVPGNKIFRQRINDLAHIKDVRSQGPAHVLRKAMDILDANPVTQPYLHEILHAADVPVGSCSKTHQCAKRVD